jgi:hypothetical protein
MPDQAPQTDPRLEPQQFQDERLSPRHRTSSVARDEPGAKPQESPLTGQLPSWDLLPPATLLQRRRSSR